MKFANSSKRRFAQLCLSALLLCSATVFVSNNQNKPTWISAAKRAAFEPAGCMDSAGRLWTLWVSSDRARETTARIDGACLLDGKVVASFSFEDSGSLPAAPHLVALNGGVYAVWEAGGESDRQLYGRGLELEVQLEAETVALGALETIPTGAVKPLVPRLAARGDSLALVYQGLNGTDYDLFFATRDADGWSPSLALTTTSLDEWNPRLAAGSGDELHIVWDFYDGKSYDVAYARIAEGKLSGRVALAAGRDYQGFPELGIDAAGAAWVTWESSAQFGEYGGLRAERHLNLARCSPISDPQLPDGTTVEYLPQEELISGVKRREFPHLAVTDTGLLLSYSSPVRGNRKRDHLFTAWMTTLIDFNNGEAGEKQVPQTDGSGDANSLLVADPQGGAWLIFSADGRRNHFAKVVSWSDAIERRPRVGVRRFRTETSFPTLVSRPTAETNSEQTPVPELVPPSDPKSTSEPRVLFGDLHRHTHLSRCSGAKDGTTLDAYRYARGPGKLDFIAITDHFQHMKPWSWLRSKRDVARYHAPGSLVVLCAIERVRAKRGHYNDIYFDATEIPFDTDAWMRPPARFAPTTPEHVISIPHMMSIDDGTGFNWDEFNEDRTRLIEIYQGKRGSYEGPDLPYEADDVVEYESALARGFERGAHFGLVAASDHVSSSTAFAGLHATELTRASVFEALRNRRSFACTVARSIDASLGWLSMGEVGDPGPEADFSIQFSDDSVEGLAYIELVKNGITEKRIAADSDLENWIITLRRVPAASRGLLTIDVRGGTVDGMSSRRPNSPGVSIESIEEQQVRFRRTDFIQIDMQLTVRWNSTEQPQSLILRAGESEVLIPRDSILAGASKLLKQDGLHALVWRQGSALGIADTNVRIKLDARPGDSYYARIAWTDGNLAWTSPIRVRSEESAK